MKQKRLSDIMESALEGTLKPFQTSELVSYILESKNAVTADNALSTAKILEEYHALQSKHPNIVNIPDNTIIAYLSLIAANDEYPIMCKGRKQGYFVDLDYFNKQGVEQAPQEKVALERDMYPLLTSWLATEGYEKVQEISNKRGMLKWGNPDIVALRTLDIFKCTMLEITTIEAKRSKANWRHDIFEAIAHTMFADRSYFAYLAKESDKNDKQMIRYAQKFHIGLISIIVPDDLWEKSLNIENVQIVEIMPAPRQDIDPDIRKEFLMNLEINDFDSYKDFAKIQSKTER